MVEAEKLRSPGGSGGVVCSGASQKLASGGQQQVLTGVLGFPFTLH